MTVKVQGETYESEADVIFAIGELEAQYVTMPEGQARADLLTHIERLRDSVDGNVEQHGEHLMKSVVPARAARRTIELSREGHTGKEDVEAEDEGAEPVCPMCNGEGVLEVDPPLHPLYERCEDCEGYGRIYTGSRREGRAVDDCPSCNGDGFKKKTVQIAPLEIEQLTHAEIPQAPGAYLSDDGREWRPALGSQPPWEGAQWDSFYGAWK